MIIFQYWNFRKTRLLKNFCKLL